MNTSHQQRHFLISQRFLPMFLTQFFGALNDNVFKQILLLLISYGWLKHSGDVSFLNNLAGLLFILPYFIFSATAGQIADRYERAFLVRQLKLLEIVIMCLAVFGLFLGNIYLLLFALFLMGTQSTFFGPIKYAILPEILKPNELISGNAIFQAGTSLAILFGMLLGGVLISTAQGNMWIISIALLSISILGYLASRAILPQKIASPDLKVNWNFFQTSWQTVAYSYRLPIIFCILLGNSWYWFYGSTLLIQIPEMTTIYLRGNETVVSFLLTCFSVGVGLGSFMCQRFGHNKTPAQMLRLVAIGAIGLTVFALYLSISLTTLLNYPSLMYKDTLFTLSEVLNMDIYYHTFIAVTCLGIVGGFYIVPLYTMMQSFSPESHRARIVASNNILNAVFMVSSAIFSIVVLSVLKLDIWILFGLIAMMNIFFTLILLRKLKSLLKNEI